MRPRCSGAGSCDAICREEPDAHGVHEAVVPVRFVEDGLAPDRRYADRISVGADPGDGTPELPARIAEAQAVEERNRPCSDGDDVPQDPADARRGALEGLDRRGMVV